MEAQAKDMDTMTQMMPPGGMGMMMGSGGRMMGPGAGMMSQGGKTGCMMDPGRVDRSQRDDSSEQRLNALEKRLDMMQMVLHMMLNH